jgi:hypothetical protein
MVLLDENPNDPTRMRRFNQILARLINRGIQAGKGLRSTEGVLRVAEGRSIFIPELGDGCTGESPSCSIDTVEVDVHSDGTLEHASDTAPDPDRVRLRVAVGDGLIAGTGLETDVGDGLWHDTGDGQATAVRLGATNPGLEFVSARVAVKLKTDGGVEKDADGLNIEAALRDAFFAAVWFGGA